MTVWKQGPFEIVSYSDDTFTLFFRKSFLSRYRTMEPLTEDLKKKIIKSMLDDYKVMANSLTYEGEPIK